jgi:L-iditol 2-dehydrogenase
MSKETPMLNPSAVLYGPHDVRIEDRPVPKPAPGQVLVEIAAIGICGSDVHYYEHGRIGDYVVHDPMIIGHESAGTVVAHRRRRRPKQGRRAGCA